jgi:hypothetical protein
MATVDEKLIWEKELRDDTQAVAEAITGHLLDSDRVEVVSFCLFMMDMRTGKVQYISDLSQADALGMLTHWVNSHRQ